MRIEDRSLAGTLRAALLERPDEVMLELGAGGELLVARLRAVLSALLLAMPVLGAATGAAAGETVIGLGVAIFINAMAQAWLALARNGRHAWLPYVSCSYDVTTVTGVLALLALGDPVAGTNNVVVWSFYLVVIAMATLRNDGRLTLYAGLLAMAQYGAFAAVVFATAGSPERLLSPDYGQAAAAGQLERLVVLLVMTLLALCIVQRMQRLVEMSGRDGSTGLPNRLWLHQQMPQMLDDLRHGGSLSLALVDLDRFRRINDELGRAGGDRALRHAVAVLAAGLHGRERLVRLGGEEFAMLVYCPLGTAWERMEQLRRSLWEQPFHPGHGAEPQRIAFSAGIAGWPQDGHDLSTLLAAADRRQQACKRLGGNRVMARDP